VKFVDAEGVQIFHVPAGENPHQLTEEDLRHVYPRYNFIWAMQKWPKSLAKFG
jgi:hypothetical protein